MRAALFALLALSIAANVFLGGFVAGRVFGGPAHHRPPMGAPLGPQGMGPQGMGPQRPPLIVAAESLSPEGRKIFRDTFEAQGERLRKDFETSRDLRRAFADAIAAEPFDRAKAEAALVALQASESESHRAAASLVIDAAEKMSPADRAVLVDAYRSYRKAHKRRGGRDGRPGPGGPPDEMP